jgi:hypothetical protein
MSEVTFYDLALVCQFDGVPYGTALGWPPSQLRELVLSMLEPRLARINDFGVSGFRLIDASDNPETHIDDAIYEGDTRL